MSAFGTGPVSSTEATDVYEVNNLTEANRLLEQLKLADVYEEVTIVHEAQEAISSVASVPWQPASTKAKWLREVAGLGPVLPQFKAFHAQLASLLRCKCLDHTTSSGSALVESINKYLQDMEDGTIPLRMVVKDIPKQQNRRKVFQSVKARKIPKALPVQPPAKEKISLSGPISKKKKQVAPPTYFVTLPGNRELLDRLNLLNPV